MKECILQNEIHRLPEGSFNAHHLQYVLTTANNWKNGIEDFNLKISGGNVILVKIGQQVDADIGEYRFQRKNFRPKGELTVEFLGKGDVLRMPAGIKPIKEIRGPAECREKPSGKVLHTVAAKTKVTLRERSKDDYQVEFDGKSCWVQRKDLAFLGS